MKSRKFVALGFCLHFTLSNMTNLNTTYSNRVLNAAVIVAALGYFVDIYDLLLFSIVRVQSLKSLGFSGQELTDKGILLLDVQMIGMLLGGILWGVWGDKRGRLTVLFGSIFLYSVANIANGMVNSIETYALWRFIAGIGLAGELGAGITLVTEILPKEKRGYGTTIVASVGIMGAVAAGIIADNFDWRTCYYIGGGLGLLLLVLRIGVSESGMFAQAKQEAHKRGDFLALFRNKSRFLKYLRFILIGLPIWYAVGILITLSPEFAPLLGVTGAVLAGKSVMFCYAGMVVGDVASGLLSQYLKSRVKVLYIFWSLSVLAIGAYFSLNGLSVAQFYGVCAFLGFSVGSWVIFMTSAAEQFGTNIRATVTTTVPNFVRASVVPMTALFQILASFTDIITAAVMTGLLALILAAYAISTLHETFHEDLDYSEEM